MDVGDWFFIFFFWLILFHFWIFLKELSLDPLHMEAYGFHSDFSFLDPLNFGPDPWRTLDRLQLFFISRRFLVSSCLSVLSLASSSVCLWFQTALMITGLSSLMIQSSDKGLDIRSQRIRSGYPTTWPRQGKPLFYYLIT